MKIPEPLEAEMTAQQNLAVSRQLLAVALQEPLWASLTRWCIRRCVQRLDSSAVEAKLQEVKAQSDQAANGRTLF